MNMIRPTGESTESDDAKVLHNGLRILARIIAKVVLKEISEQGNGLSKSGFHQKVVFPKPNVFDQGESKLAFSVSEVAKALGLSKNSVYELVREGQIPSIKCGKRILIPRQRLMKIFENLA